MKYRNRLSSSARPSERQRASASTAWAFEPTHWLFVAALVVVVFLAYQPAWHGGLLYDDDWHVPRPELRSWYGLYRIWFDLGATQQYFPLCDTAFWLQYKLWGDAMTGYHLVNIALHAVTALMVAMILRQLKIPGAYLAAAIFALHPVHVESVAWITEQKNTLSAVFYLAAAMAYLRFDENRGMAWYFGAMALFALALSAKIVTVTLPAALLVIFWWQRGKLSWRRDVLPLVPFFAIGAVAGVFLAWLERLAANGPDFALTFLERCLLSGRVVWFYLGELFWPAKLVFINPRWEISLKVWWQYLFPLALLILLAVLWALRRRWREPLASMLFFVGTLFPVLGFLNICWFRFSYVADHFQYLASLGIITLVAAGMALLLDRWQLWNRPGGYAACLVLLTILASLTWQQSHVYADVETFYRVTSDRNPDCAVAQNNLGLVLETRGQIDEAITHYQKALAVNPDYVPAHHNLGMFLTSRGQLDEAIAHLKKVVEIDPRIASAHGDLGTALVRKGRIDEAIAEYGKALKIKPDYAEAHNNLGVALHRQGRADEASAQYRKALEFDPNFADAHCNLGLVLLGFGQFDEAIGHLQKGLEISPNNTAARNDLDIAWSQRQALRTAISEQRELVRLHPDDLAILNDIAWRLATDPNASARNGAEAIELSQRAAQLSNAQEPAILGTLAAAYAEAGQFAAAVETAKQALALAASQNNASLAETLRARIKLYQAGSPYRDTQQPSPPSFGHP
jgi:protein O-mannosyl-transferase